MGDVSDAPAQPVAPAADPAQTPKPSGHPVKSAAQGSSAMPDLNALLEQMESLNSFRSVYESMLARAEAAAQGPPVMHTADEIPSMIESLGSGDASEFNKGAQSLDSIARRQPELLKSDILPLLPSIIAAIPTFPDVGRPSAIINLLFNFRLACREALNAVDTHVNLEEVALMLKKWEPGAVDARKAWLRLLENMLMKDRSSIGEKPVGELEKKFVSVFRTQFYTFGCKDDIVEGKGKGKANAMHSGDWNIEGAFNVIKTLELVPGNRSYIALRSAIFKAGALEFLIRVATTPSKHPSLCSSTPTNPDDQASSEITITSLRVEAVTLLAHFYDHIVKETVIPTDFSHLSYAPDAKFDLQGRVLMPLLDIIDDEDVVVSDEVADFLFGRFNDPDKAVEVYLWTHEGSMERLVHKLALSGGKKGKGQSRLEGWAMMQSMGIDPMQMMGLSTGEDDLAEEQAEKPAPAPDLGDSHSESGEAKDEVQAPASAVDNEQEDIGGERSEQQAVSSNADVDKEDGEGKSEQQEEAFDHSEKPGREEEQREQQASAPSDSEMGDEVQPEICEDPAGQSPATVHDTQKPEQQASIEPQRPSTTMSPARLNFLKMLSWADSHSQAEWLLSQALERNPDGGVDAFESFWGRRNVDEETRQELLRVLSTAVKPVREAAMDAGLPVVRKVQESTSAREGVQVIDSSPGRELGETAVATETAEETGANLG